MVGIMKLNNRQYPSDFDVYLFHEGTLFESYKMLGAHILYENNIQGVRFAVWAPHARQVSVVGIFNKWNGTRHPMERLDSGIWVLFIPELSHGDIYKYEVIGPDGRKELKADPYAFYSELRPATASIIYNLNTFEWQDQKWMAQRIKKDIYHKPMMIYEVHLASWKQKEDGEFYSYQELADELVDYAIDNGFTHIELMPVMEHPYDGSWGYQITGYYSASSRYGTPEQLMYLIDQCHQKGLGVILDWVPAHFCKDAHGLGRFDGTPLFESVDPLRAERPIWGTYSFDYSKPEVVSFLISNAMFWMDFYHVDGIRVDAVSSMIYLNHDNPLPVKLKNQFGGEENLEAIEFLKKLNETIFRKYPGALMMAEEATEWPLVTSPTSTGGLGFNYKWNMGWSNDVLKYMRLDVGERPKHHHLLTFSFLYAFSENFVLPFSHDEMVHGKRSLLNKMPGDYWQKFANLRLLFGYLFAHPGKKLLFMGSEIGQFDEWKYQQEMDWMLLDFEAHSNFYRYYKELNKFYQETSALWRLDHEQTGFHWIDADNTEQSVITFMRRGKRKGDYCIVVCNFSADVYHNYQIGVPSNGNYFEAFNSDATSFGGSGQLNSAPIHTSKIPHNNQPYCLEITVPPLGIAIFMKETKTRKGESVQMASKKWVAMLLAGGQGSRLGELTSDLAKPAVPFGGKYRIIDFTLSNCTHSGIDTVGILTQYRPHILNSYIGNGRPWDLDRNNGGVSILPPYQGKDGGEWYKGTANAVYQNFHFIDHNDPEYVLVISGDHIYKMDYNKMLEDHIDKGAHATIAVIEVPWEQANRFGIMNTDEMDQIIEFDEKPKHPKSNLASMGVYIFNWKHLKKYLTEDEKDSSSTNDFGKDIIPKMLQDDAKLQAYRFKGYWKDVGTIDSLWEAHMDLLEEPSDFKLGDPNWQIYAGNANHPPQYISEDADVTQSLVNEGCLVFGKVDHSVLSYNVQVGSGSIVKNSVIMPNVKIGNNVIIEKAIIGSGTIIEDGAVISDTKQRLTLIGENQLVSSESAFLQAL